LSSQVKILSEKNESLSHDNKVLESLVVTLDASNKSLSEDIESLRAGSKRLEESQNSDAGVSENQTVSEIKEEARGERMKAPILESVVDAPRSVSIASVPKATNSRLERMFKNQTNNQL
jgi:3-polyprenyl-4-hydroxybenzoate decarboxylase